MKYKPFFVKAFFFFFFFEFGPYDVQINTYLRNSGSFVNKNSSPNPMVPIVRLSKDFFFFFFFFCERKHSHHKLRLFD